jgi:hypothetical protein
MIKKFAILIGIGLAHFTLSALVVPGAMLLAGGPFMQPEPPLAFRILVVVTRILYFPVISLSLYSRQWFPGNWIYLPIAVNSLLWATVIGCLILLYQKVVAGRKQDGRRDH